MTIASTTNSYATQASRPERPPKPPTGGGPGGPQGAGGPKPEEMKAAIEKLKSSNPELAEKMEKIGTRMEELKNSGVSMEEAHKTIESEFGKPTDEERSQVDTALGRPQRAKSFASTQGSLNVSELLSTQNQNADVLKFLEDREAAA